MTLQSPSADGKTFVSSYNRSGLLVFSKGLKLKHPTVVVQGQNMLRIHSGESGSRGGFDLVNSFRLPFMLRGVSGTLMDDAANLIFSHTFQYYLERLVTNTALIKSFRPRCSRLDLSRAVIFKEEIFAVA